METPSKYGEDESSHNKFVASYTKTPNSALINNSCNKSVNNTSIDSNSGSKVDENICSFYDTDKFDVTGSTALVEEVCNNKSRVVCDVLCSGDGDVSQQVILDENQTSSDKNRKQTTTEFCCCPYERMSEADTEYRDFSQTSPIKCSNFDENCFCHHSDDMSSLSMNSSDVNVVKKNYRTNRRLIKIRIKTSSSKECSVEGESTENGIKICISPRETEAKRKSNHEYALNETYSITSSRRVSRTTSEVESSGLETEYEFRKTLKNELKRSPAAIKVLNYLESLSEAKKKTTDVKKERKRTSVPLVEQKPRQHRSKSTTPPKRARTPQSVMSVENDEFHDCCDKTVPSGTDTSVTSEYEDTSESFEVLEDRDTKSKKGAPLITITQEMSAQMVVTSKFEINKQKLKQMNETRERRQSKESRESPDKIIDDNFSNEILEKMNQLRVGLSEDPSLADTDATMDPLDIQLDISAGPQKPPRTFAFRRSQENAVKNPKPSDMRSSLESLDLYLYEEMKQLKLFKFNQSRNLPKPKLDESNYVVGGWKVAPEVLVKNPIKIFNKPEIGWTTPVQSPKKVAPGWVKPSPAVIPEDIVNMLHYSDDEVKKRSILSSNARAEPQQKLPSSNDKHQMGPKLDIDTVDAVIHTPSSSSNNRFEEFASNPRARSTPRRKEPHNNNFGKKLEPYLNFKRTKEICKKFLERERGSGASEESKSVNPLPSVEEFLEKERGASEICKKCCREVNPKRPKFHQKAFKRTKSLFVASKKKIGGFRHSKDKVDGPKYDDVLSDSDPYCTPENGNTPHKSPKRQSFNSLENPIPVVPKHATQLKQPSFNYNAPLPQSPQRPLLEVTPPRKSPLHLKIKLSPKRLFGMSQADASTSTSPNMIPPLGDYKSFEDQDQNLAATMGEILSQLRQIIEGNPDEVSNRVLSEPRVTNPSTNQIVNVLLHQPEPDYAEILQTQLQSISPYKKKKSPPITRIERNNNEYIIVNNDPNAIYATVVKKYDDVIKSKSLSNLYNNTDTKTDPGTRKMSSHNNTPSKPIRKKRSSRRRITFNVQPQMPSNTTVTPDNHSNAITSSSSAFEANNPIRRISTSCSSLTNPMEGKITSKNLFGSDQCIKVSVKELDFPRKFRVINEKYQKRTEDFEKEVQQIAYDTNIMDQYLDSLNKILNKKLVVDDKNIKKATEDFLLKEIEIEGREAATDDQTCHVDKDALSTGGTYKSFGFPRPDAKRCGDHEQSFSLNYSSGDVDSQNNDAGYDEVDFKPYHKEPMVMQTHAIDEIICEEEFDQYFNSDEKQRQVTSLDDTLTTETTTQSSSSGNTSRLSSAHASPAKPQRRGSLYRSFKNSLRSSFRKGRNFIKHEQDKLVQLFDKNAVVDGNNAVPKPARSFVNLDEYKKYYNDKNAEQIYNEWSEKLARSESHTDLHGKRMLELIGQISSQRQIKKQLKNALEICRCSKEFDCSSELVEAERLLLVSNLKEASAKKELMEMENNLYANIKQTPNNDLGMISLSDFEFPLKDAAMYDTLYNYFYICVATYKDQVKASYAKEREGNTVSFRGFEIKFWEVEPDYQIKVEVFVLSLRKTNRGATESRLSATKNSMKMSPRRFFGGSPSEKVSSSRPELEFSQFASQGFLFVTSSSFVSYSESLTRRQIPDTHIDLPYYSSSNFHQYLKKSGDHHIHCIEDYRSFRMNQVIYNSHMTGQIQMAIKNEVVFDGSNMCGFLTIGESINGTIMWNRRWCKVNGLCLNFWNYPQEANDGKTPIEVIDISKCENDYIYQADRAICPRPRAIVIEQADSSTTIDSKPGYYFLVTDNKQELRDWLRELNKILKFVRDWKL